MSASASKHKLAFMQSFFSFFFFSSPTLYLSELSIICKINFIARDKQFKFRIKNPKRKLFTLDQVVCWSINPGDLLSAFNDAVMLACYFSTKLSMPAQLSSCSHFKKKLEREKNQTMQIYFSNDQRRRCCMKRTCISLTFIEDVFLLENNNDENNIYWNAFSQCMFCSPI